MWSYIAGVLELKAQKGSARFTPNGHCGQSEVVLDGR